MTLAPLPMRGFFIGLRLEKMLKPEQIDEILNIFICGLFAAIGGGAILSRRSEEGENVQSCGISLTASD